MTPSVGQYGQSRGPGHRRLLANTIVPISAARRRGEIATVVGDSGLPVGIHRRLVSQFACSVAHSRPAQRYRGTRLDPFLVLWECQVANPPLLQRFHVGQHNITK